MLNSEFTVARPSSVSASPVRSRLIRPLIVASSMVRFVIFALAGAVPLATQKSNKRSGTESASSPATFVLFLTMMPDDQGPQEHCVNRPRYRRIRLVGERKSPAGAGRSRLLCAHVRSGTDFKYITSAAG
jgi:hypothetical protein